MLQINRLRIQLPAGMELRAADIAREVGHGLAKAKINHNTGIEKRRITVKNVRIGSGADSRDIAQQVVRHITRELGCEP